MVVIYKKRAKNAILHTVKYIEENNTAGSGSRWFNKLDAFVHSLAQAKADYGLCKSHTLSKFSYSCYSYGNWIIAYKVRGNKFEVCRFIYGRRITA